MASKSYLAGGTIHRARFVTQNTGADNTVDQAGANAVIVGISQLGGRRAPQPSNSNTTEAATVGEYLDIDSEDGAVGYVECGGTVAAGDKLKSDSNGKAVVIASAGGSGNQHVGAIAQAAGASGTIIPVQIRKETVYIA